MRLVFCRHGETVANLEDRFQGVSDTILTEKGKQQAQRLNKYLKNIQPIRKFLISPFPRVLSTYEIASQGIEAKVVQEDTLKEMSYGEFETKGKHEIDDEILEEREKNRFHYSHPGHHRSVPGESYSALYDRVSSFLENLVSNVKKNETVVVISHQGVMVCVRKFFLKLTDKEAGKLRVPNDEVFVVEKNDDNKISTRIVMI